MHVLINDTPAMMSEDQTYGAITVQEGNTKMVQLTCSVNSYDDRFRGLCTGDDVSVQIVGNLLTAMRGPTGLTMIGERPASLYSMRMRVRSMKRDDESPTIVHLELEAEVVSVPGPPTLEQEIGS